jgi:hypothetical protein
MAVKGYVINNTEKAKHIFKKKVVPGDKIDLEYLKLIFKNELPKDSSIEQWLKARYLPDGWEVVITEEIQEDEQSTPPVKVILNGKEVYKEHLLARPEVAAEGYGETQVIEEPDGVNTSLFENLAYASPNVLRNLSARQIYNLRLQDDPKRAIKEIDSIHKLRRSLTLCKKDGRKEMLMMLIKRRIDEIVNTGR